ncbi:PREDICTED: dolichyl-diphosphooligosaccharide--protein glycosyltransferase subunit DAD1 [Chaetura pelagica]|uniref:dolichyl-diphosphooligosaccharide--protein glycosyltransferase subunit DAD1 n=1 Tax=Chaetura pelagica TaxID=8897 RepID=UPI000523D16A|nr:PREDICTED: dolichyl-diphosphooligosaccharide--protein glycosyltransferase subunit DAD1 [Chaetura pelagica]
MSPACPFRRDRQGRKGGGADLCVNDLLQSMELHLGMNEEQTKSLWVRVKVFNSHITQVAEGKGRDCEKEDPPTVGEEQVQDHLKNLKVHKSMGPDEIHLRLLRELGFISAVGSFILGVCLRIQINPQNKGEFQGISPERAFADFLFANTILHLVVINFVG